MCWSEVVLGEILWGYFSGCCICVIYLLKSFCGDLESEVYSSLKEFAFTFLLKFTQYSSY